MRRPVTTGSADPADRAPRYHRVFRLLAWAALSAVIIVGAAIGLLANTQPGSGPRGTSADDVAIGYVEEQLRAQGTPDSAFAAVRDGKITTSGSLGDGVTTDTPFLIGSLSKPFTALAVMQLVEAGEIALDAPVTDYLPWFTTADGGTDITIRQLLTQTSGLPTWAGQVDLYDHETTLEQRVRAIADVEPAHEPGTTFEYCNKNYATLGLVVQKVAGMSYAQYLQIHVFEPSGMNRTFTNLEAAKHHGLVDGAAVLFGAHLPHTPSAYPGALPDGYIVSTVKDLARFAKVQTDGSADGHRIISERSLAQMHQPPADAEPDDFYNARYGLGWRISTMHGKPVIAHEGDLGTYHANLGVLPDEGRALVILTAHNTMLADVEAAHRGGMAVLAGEAAPPVDRGYVTSYLAVTVLGAIVFVALLASSARLVRRVRAMPERIRKHGRTRAVTVPVVGRLLAAAAVYVAVFLGLGRATGQPGFMPLPMSYGSVPDVTAIVLMAIGYLAAAAILLLAAGVRAGRRSVPEGNHGR